jgi:CubicO group peptidase (beta-lactamase class C family)
MRTAIAVLAALLAISAEAQVDRQKLAAAYPEIEKLFDAYVERSHMPGAAIGIVVDGDLVWTRTKGVQTVGGAPFTVDTTSRIASMTKSFTAAGILKLRDEGKLALDDPASKYIPELAGLAYPTSDSPQITVRHLLTHMEGFPEDNPWGDRQLAEPNATMDAWMKAGVPFSTTPGTAWEYSNYGFAMLGRIIERVSGQPYDAYIRTAFLEPLGMTSSTFHDSAVPRERKALGYRWLDEKWIEIPILAHGSFGAMGGLWTTTRDLAKWVTFLMSAYPARSGADSGPLKRSSLREMQELAALTPYSSARRNAVDAPLTLTAMGYGYGLMVAADCQFKHVVSHGGGLPGYGSLMTWLPQHGVGLVFMSNRTYGGAGRLFPDVLTALNKTGGLKPRRIPASPAVLAAQAGATKLLMQWSEEDAIRLTGDNFLLDKSAARWQKDTSDLVAKHGKCTAGPIEPENALRGKWKLTCERGTIDVWMTLTPQMPPRIQYLYAASVLPPDTVLTSRVDVALRPVRGSLSLFAKDFDHAKLQRQLTALITYWGACKTGEAIRGDGTLTVGMKLACEKGEAAIDVELDKDTKKIKSVSIAPSGDQTCVP